MAPVMKYKKQNKKREKRKETLQKVSFLPVALPDNVGEADIEGDVKGKR
jgi:hypothetical protein